MKRIHPLVLCGGSGTRLWPISRTRSPKQFQKIGDEHSPTFFQAAIQRHSGEAYHPPCIVTNLRHRGTVVSQLRDIQSDSQIICEPMGRNTGPAVLAAAHALAGRDPNAIILVVPADHVIEGDINKTINEQVDAVLDGHIVTFGIAPRGPETGFGYIVPDAPVEGFPDLKRVKSFIEKPPLKTAKKLVNGGDATWASGISMFAARTIIEEYEKYDPETAENVKKSVMGATLFPEALYLDADGFSQAKAEPTEKAVFENTDRISTVALDVKWSDVGSWAAMYDISKSDRDGNVLQGDVMAVNSTNTLVRAEDRLVSVVGVSDIIIVDTSDALLVTRRDNSQHVKEVVEKLKKTGRSEAEHNVGAAPKMVPFSMPAIQEQIHQTESYQLGTSQLSVGAVIDMQQGHGQQVIVVKGMVHAQGPGWQKSVREGGRIYSDPDGSIRITNCADTETELLFMEFDVPVESPKSLPMASVG